jgi:septal ring-binding cell division protein DamX
VLSLTPATAASVSDALVASQRGENQTALSILKELAASGNTLAQYNLALFYKKGIAVTASVQLANYWFSQAAQRGIVDGAEQLAADSINPGKGVDLNLVLGPKEWIRAQKPGDYTIQLASSKSLDLVERNFHDHHLLGRGGYFLDRQKGRYVLVYGVFPSAAEAYAASKDLPRELRKWSPWVRKLSKIQQRLEESQ